MKHAILGCGWLGLPLAQYMIEQGQGVKGSTTRKEKLDTLEELGIEPYLIELLPYQINGDIESFAQADTLVLNFPPGRHKLGINLTFPQTIQRLIRVMEQVGTRHVVFVSSTSVYGNQSEPVTEESPTIPARSSSTALVEVEEMLQSSQLPVTILRMGGLVGYNRRPGRFLAGRRDLGDGDAPVNLLHLDDAVRVIWEVIRQERWNEVYNVCADQHPKRKDFYTYAAQSMGLPSPQFLEGEQTSQQGKWVCNAKIKRDLGYEFSYPDPYGMVAGAV
jgi:nucleoside-diphosphate-sugar epimerase